MASVIEFGMVLAPAIITGVATIMTVNAARGIFNDALNGYGIDEDNIKETNENYQDENADQGDSSEDDFFNALEGEKNYLFRRDTADK